MIVVIPSGVISVGKAYTNTTVDKGYSFTNGTQDPS
jgi:hypothetical protein